MRTIKTIISKIDRLIELIEDSGNIFIEERPFLFDDKNLIFNYQNEKRTENETKILETIKSIEKDIAIPIKQTTQTAFDL